jgi:hypothetical protein
MAPKKSDNYVEVVPNAARMIAALRELGYRSAPAICDLIDNSIGAGATHIWVTVRSESKGHIIDVRDNGVGMSKDRLTEALRFGSDTEQDVRTLGKYGMGLKTAGLSIAKCIWVMTREKGQQAWEATLDVDVIEAEGKFVIERRPATKHVLETVGDQGTLVRLSNVDRLDDTNVTRFTDELRKVIGRVFRHFLKNGLIITLRGKDVEPIDPLLRDRGSEVRFDEDVTLCRGCKAHLTVVELPNDLTPEEEAIYDIDPRHSGFYVMRNHRQIMEAQTFGLYQHHHTYSRFRAELSFDGSEDEDFHVDIMKSSILPNDQMLEHIRVIVSKYIERSGREGRERGVAKPKAMSAAARLVTPDAEVPWRESDFGDPKRLLEIEESDGGGVRVHFNSRSPLMQLVAELRSRKAALAVGWLCQAFARTIGATDKKMLDKFNQTIQTLLDAGTEKDTWEQRDKTHAGKKVS